MEDQVIWLVKEEHEMMLEMNNTRMVRWMGNARPEGTISAEKLWSKLRNLVTMEENTWLSKCRNFNASGKVPKGRSKKTWNEGIRSDLKERKVSART